MGQRVTNTVFVFWPWPLPTEIVIHFLNPLIMQWITYDYFKQFKFNIKKLSPWVPFMPSLSLIILITDRFWNRCFIVFLLSTAQLLQFCISPSHLFFEAWNWLQLRCTSIFKGCFSTFIFRVKLEMIWKVLLSYLVFYFTHLFLVGIQPLNCQFVNNFDCLIVWPYIYKNDPNRYFLLCFTGERIIIF